MKGVEWFVLSQALTQGLLLPVQKIEVGDEFTGATVIDPVKGYVVPHREMENLPWTRSQ